jgi:hypothetical protein
MKTFKFIVVTSLLIIFKCLIFSAIVGFSVLFFSVVSNFTENTTIEVTAFISGLMVASYCTRDADKEWSEMINSLKEKEWRFKKGVSENTNF